MAQISEWLAVAPLSEMDLEQHLLKRGRGLPDDMEIEFLTRKPVGVRRDAEVFPWARGHAVELDDPPGRRWCLRSPRRGDGQRHLQPDLVAHLTTDGSSPVGSTCSPRLVFFFNDSYTKRLAARIEAWLKDGFTAQKDVVLARAQLSVIESFYSAYPDRSSQLRDLNAALDLAEFSFSQPTVGQAELVHEGLHSGFARDVSPRPAGPEPVFRRLRCPWRCRMRSHSS